MPRTPLVSPDECHRMRELHADGVPLTDIATELGRTHPTVKRHVRENCKRHAETARESQPLSQSFECPFCDATVSLLPDHLPCEASP